MTDDEILAVANEVLIPKGVLGAKIRHLAMDGVRDKYLAVSIPAQGGKEAYHFGWRVFPETIPESPTRSDVICAARSCAAYYMAAAA